MVDSYQITAVGDGFVGKTCLLIRYTTDSLPKGYEPTVFDNYAGTIEVDCKEYNIQLWDTAGQEDYERLRPLSYKTAHCFLICFSVDSQDSFENVATKWAPEIQYCKRKTPIILVGMKIDLRNDPKLFCLEREDGAKLKKRIKAKKYVECSSVTGEGVHDVFAEAVRAIVQQTRKYRKIPCNLF